MLKHNYITYNIKPYVYTILFLTTISVYPDVIEKREWFHEQKLDEK